MIGKKINKISIPEKENFLIHINMEVITCAGYAHARFCEDFKVINVYDLYGQSYTLLLATGFENFPNMCFEIYELGPARILNSLN